MIREDDYKNCQISGSDTPQDPAIRRASLAVMLNYPEEWTFLKSSAATW